jgi:FkbM family methyltransferase
MECFIEPGTVLWDVGANVGYLCLDLIQTHPEIAAIHAFEPNPAARKVIESMFSQHLKVKVHPVGLGQQDQTLSLSFEPSGSETGSLVREFGPTNRVAVDVRHGDAYRTRNRIPLPDVLKIDVEGFEPQVFVGLSDTIEKSRPVILFEHHFLSEEDTLAVIPPGYHAYLILKSGDLTKDLARRAESSDCLLVPEEKLNRLPVTLR